MDSEIFINRLNQAARTGAKTSDWDARNFQHVLDRFHKPLHRYYAVHTGGELTQVQRMIVETFSIIYRRPVPLANESLPSWIFGIAWDVLNAHLSREDRDVQADSQTLIARILAALRAVAFYPREALYLRFFAELDPKDIMLMIDKSEIVVKNLVYQATRDFACRMNAVELVVLPRNELLPLAQEYHKVVSHMLAGNTSLKNTSPEVMQATHQLNTLRIAFSIKPESHLQLISQVEQLLRAGHSSATRL